MRLRGRSLVLVGENCNIPEFSEEEEEVLVKARSWSASLDLSSTEGGASLGGQDDVDRKVRMIWTGRSLRVGPEGLPGLWDGSPLRHRDRKVLVRIAGRRWHDQYTLVEFLCTVILG
ncbi:unnamed protein product [Lactuca virosa]|uniref:Uncharacterized protein n=1 Tax=Lactuca virosa TaxID=75947 RepID=A0AAU9NFZ8_9ASTR|nr:unnamed protein product [Lactuca virosa]